MSTPAEVMNAGILPDPTHLHEQNQQRFAGDERLYVQFHIVPVMNEFKSKEAERLIYEDVLFVRILVPGDKHSIVNRQATPEDKRRFSKQLNAFNEGQEQQDQGTPLNIVPWLSPAQVEEYRFFNIFTVEQLAECPDSNGQKFINFHEHKRKAAQFVQGLVPENVQQELDQRDATIAEQADRLAALEAKLASLMEGGEPELEA